MSTFTSSAISTGKKIAPKAIGRRRPVAEAPVAAQPTAPTPPSTQASEPVQEIASAQADEDHSAVQNLPGGDAASGAQASPERTATSAEPTSLDSPPQTVEPPPAYSSVSAAEEEPAIGSHLGTTGPPEGIANESHAQPSSLSPRQAEHESAPDTNNVPEAQQDASGPVPQEHQAQSLPEAASAAENVGSGHGSQPPQPSSPGRDPSPAPVGGAKRKLGDAALKEKVGPANKRAKKSALAPKKPTRRSASNNPVVSAPTGEDDVPIPSIEDSVVAATPTAMAKAAPKKRQPRKKAVTSVSDDTQTQPADDNPPTRLVSQPKRATKRKKPLPAETIHEDLLEDAQQGDSTATHRTAIVKHKPTPRPRKRRRKSPEKDASQPRSGEENQDEIEEEEDPELHIVDPNVVSMSELARDRGLGKTSEREREMAKIDWAEVARNRREDYEKLLQKAREEAEAKERGEAPPVSEEAPAPSDALEPSAEEAQAAATEIQPSTDGLRIRLDENGMIIHDGATLTIDRHAAAAAIAEDQVIEEQVDLKTRINRTTWMNERKREKIDRIPVQYSKSDPWTEEETERFYDALKMFGTDFMTISRMFVPKTRRHIKLKFNREERACPERINAALIGKDIVPIGLDHFAQEAGRDVSIFHKYEGLQDAIQKLGEETAAEREELERQAQEATDNQRRKTKRQLEQEQSRAKREEEKDARRAAGRGRRGQKMVGFGTFGGAPDDAE